MTWQTSLRQGLTGLINLFFAMLIGRFIAGIMDESRRQRALIAELRTTREELARERHQAGVTAERERLAREIHDTLAQGFTSVVMLTQALLPLVADGGRILNVSTGLTLNLVNPAYSVYASMKAAVEVYSRYLAKSLGARGIAVNVLAPGATATDFGGGLIRDNPQYRGGITASTAMGRVGEPDDIGRAAASILSEGMAWVTGQRIEASGGQGMGYVAP